MGFTQAVKSVFSKYAVFSGRASRSEYWYFVLFNVLVGIAVGIIAACSGNVSTYVDMDRMTFTDNMPSWLYWFTGIYQLFIILPTLAVSVRRMHDIGKGGGWIFINFVLVIGSIWFFVLTVIAGQYGPNRFGPQPL